MGWILMIFLAALLIIGIPILIAVFGYKKLRKTKLKKVAFILPVLIMGVVGTVLYLAIYPPNDFYAEDFKENTAIALPASAKIIVKDASYPDTHGHYTSAAFITVSADDYNTVLAAVRSNSDFVVDTLEMDESSEYAAVTKMIKRQEISYSYSSSLHRNYFRIGFIEQRSAIIFENEVH